MGHGDAELEEREAARGGVADAPLAVFEPLLQLVPENAARKRLHERDLAHLQAQSTPGQRKPDEFYKVPQR